jgi:hypothetical protein
MIIKLVRSEVFIPEWNGNRSAEDQIKITLRYLTVEERTKTSTFKSHVSADGSIQIDPINDYDAMLKFSIQKIDGLEIEIDGVVEKIDTIDKLKKQPGLKGLYDELATYVYMTSGLSDETKKN